MSLGSDAYEVDGVSVVRLVQHVVGLSEAQVSEDIHGQPVTPVGHVLGGSPSLLLVNHTAQVANRVAKRPDVGEDVTLHLLDGAVREGMRQHSALPRVDLLVARVVGVW